MIIDLWIILTGCFVAIPCALLGCYLILRKMVMIGDAISHAVLPGIVIAYLLTGTFDSFVMLIGASLTGLATTALIEFFHTKGQLQKDASIGVTFTWLFAFGIILITSYTSGVDIDQDCVLYGDLVNIPFSLWITESGTVMGPKAIWFLGFITLFVIGYICLFNKELTIITFDPGYAAITGISIALWHYTLMGAVSVVTVASFQAVGAILVLAFLVVPPATAYLLTNSLSTMLWLSILFSVISVVGGFFIALWLDVTTSGSMAAFSGLIFFSVFIYKNIFEHKLHSYES